MMYQRKIMIMSIVCVLSMGIVFSSYPMESYLADITNVNVQDQRKTYLKKKDELKVKVQQAAKEEQKQKENVAKKKVRIEKENAAIELQVDNFENKAQLKMADYDAYDLLKVTHSQKFFDLLEQCQNDDQDDSYFIKDLMEDSKQLAIASIKSGECDYRDFVEENEESDMPLNNSSSKTKDIVVLKTPKPRPTIEQIRKNAPKDLFGCFYYMVKHRQIKDVKAMLEDEAEKDKLLSKSSFVKFLYQILHNEQHSVILFTFNNKKIIPQSSIDYVALQLAKLGKNVQYIDCHHKYLMLKSIAKVKSEKLVPIWPQCYGWEFGCKKYKTCEHSIKVGDIEYKRYCKVSIKGETILEQKCPFTRSLLKSCQIGDLLWKSLVLSDAYLLYKKNKKDKVNQIATMEKWLNDREELTLQWLLQNKNKKDYKKVDPVAVVNKNASYSASIILPTSYEKKLTCVPLVSAALKLSKATRDTYGHTPFVQIL